MADPYALIKARLIAIICRGRGTAPPFSAAAQARAIPADRFRYARKGLADKNFSGSAFDRGVFFRRPRNAVGGAGPNDAMFDKREQFIRFEICVGAVEGAPSTELVHAQPGESQADAVLEPDDRAMRDASLIERALSMPDLTQGDLGSGIRILKITPGGDSQGEELGGGRYLHSQSYLVHAWVLNTD